MEDRQPSLPPPAEDAAMSFTASWTPSKATAFAATNIPLSKKPRPWDRKPTTAADENGKVKTVWKRYGLRSGPVEEPQSEQMPRNGVDTKSPGRAVKKLRIGSPVKRAVGQNHKEESSTQRKSAGTKYERRKSGYRRKQGNTAPKIHD